MEGEEFTMKVISLYQPWATLVAIGAKKIETRSWRTSYRGPLAIHSSKNKKFVDFKSPDYICCSEPFYAVLTEAMVESFGTYGILKFMPLQCIIATCELVDCRLISQGDTPGEPERSFGNYTPGRFKWVLSNVKRINPPIMVSGSIGLWQWNGEIYES
jgi:hypothetical protein